LLRFAIIVAYYYILASQKDPSWKTTTSTLALQWGENRPRRRHGRPVPRRPSIGAG